MSGHYTDKGAISEHDNKKGIVINLNQFVQWITIIKNGGYIERISSIQNDPKFDEKLFDAHFVGDGVNKDGVNKDQILADLETKIVKSSSNKYILEPIVGNDENNIQAIYKKEQNIHSYLQKLDKSLAKMNKYFCEQSKQTNIDPTDDTKEAKEKAKAKAKATIISITTDITNNGNYLKNDTYWLSEMHRIRKLHVRQGIIETTTKPDSDSGNTYSADITTIGSWTPEYGKGIGRKLKRNIAIPATKLIRIFEKFGIMTTYWFILRPLNTLYNAGWSAITNGGAYASRAIGTNSPGSGGGRGCTKSNKRKKKSKTLKRSKTLKKRRRQHCRTLKSSKS